MCIVWCIVMWIVGLLMCVISWCSVLVKLLCVLLARFINWLVSSRFQVEVFISSDLLWFRCLCQFVLLSLLWISMLVVCELGMCSSVLVMYISSMFFLLDRLYWCMKDLIMFWFLVCVCMWVISVVVWLIICLCLLLGRFVWLSRLSIVLVLLCSQVVVMCVCVGVMLGGSLGFRIVLVMGCLIWVGGGWGRESGVLYVCVGIYLISNQLVISMCVWVWCCCVLLIIIGVWLWLFGFWVKCCNC